MRIILALTITLLITPALAQAPAADMTEQRAAIAALDFLDGEWVGEAVAANPRGEMKMVQTERIGSLLGGTIKVIEGRGYDASGTTVFNAMAIVSWDAAAKRYRMRSYAQAARPTLSSSARRKGSPGALRPVRRRCVLPRG